MLRLSLHINIVYNKLFYSLMLNVYYIVRVVV